MTAREPVVRHARITPDEVGRIIICQPPPACTCPAVAWHCRGDCKGAVAARAQVDRQTRSAPGPTVDKPDDR